MSLLSIPNIGNVSDSNNVAYRLIRKRELGRLIQRFKLSNYGYSKRAKIGIGGIKDVAIKQNKPGCGYSSEIPPIFLSIESEMYATTLKTQDLSSHQYGKLTTINTAFGGSGFLIQRRI